MKFIWLSVAPWAPTGYGVVTSELVPRIVKEGHEVIIATKHFHTGVVDWNGCEVINGMDVGLLNRWRIKQGVDYIITLLDIHALPSLPEEWIAYCPFDTEHVPSSIESRLSNIKLLIALTKHGQEEYAKVGYPSMYAPHGVDTKVFYPDALLRREHRRQLDWEDKFIVGGVGVNYPDDRKNFVNLFLAFERLHERHPEARLYISANLVDERSANLLPLIVEDLGISDLVKWASDDEYHIGKVTTNIVANRYRMFDVFCLPTKGEGFGLPLIEAQACGVPIITTDASTGPELTEGGWLIPVKDGDWQWFNQSWRASVGSEAILDKLEEAYQSWKAGKLHQIGLEASAVIKKKYDWDTVFDTYWKPILKEIEGLKTKVKTIPDYKKLYESFDGRIAMIDCGEWCKDKPCALKFHLLPNEPDVERPILSRSYPIRPASNGELVVDTTCPLHKWLSKRLTTEAKQTWKELWGYPEIRRGFQDAIPDYFVLLDDIKVDFNDEYKWAMQSRYRTICPDLTPYIKDSDTVLDIGCGDGNRVEELRTLGIDAIGVEVNQACVDGDAVIEGDAENLVFDDDSFDVVLSIDVLEHLNDPLKAIAEMFRVSRNKIIVIVTPVDTLDFWQDPTHKVEWDIERWKREFNEFGQITEILKLPKPCGFVLEKRKCQ